MPSTINEVPLLLVMYKPKSHRNLTETKITFKLLVWFKPENFQSMLDSQNIVRFKQSHRVLKKSINFIQILSFLCSYFQTLNSLNLVVIVYGFIRIRRTRIISVSLIYDRMSTNPLILYFLLQELSLRLENHRGQPFTFNKEVTFFTNLEQKDFYIVARSSSDLRWFRTCLIQ